jgi:DnaJ-class molecular chaperone
MTRGWCHDCDGGWLRANGKCAQCHGTGVNTQLDSAQEKCPFCKGTGVCPTCGGSGIPGGDPADLIDLGLNS